MGGGRRLSLINDSPSCRRRTLLSSSSSPPPQVTVSTVGLVDRLEEFVARCSSAQLAVSLHATTDAVRRDALGMSSPCLRHN
jgi:hypothetical protein